MSAASSYNFFLVLAAISFCVSFVNERRPRYRPEAATHSDIGLAQRGSVSFEHGNVIGLSRKSSIFLQQSPDRHCLVETCPGRVEGSMGRLTTCRRQRSPEARCRFRPPVPSGGKPCTDSLL